ncbi:acyltransferase family protein [Enterobacter sp. 22466]|uniref:acyltransferase family protein n=1 Tax=Enterobacter sp. 22466 TaxID=3453924 RepID=UPI003F862DBA
MEFRKDINGLRAFAILGVLIFHFNHNALPGGFSGVDVFFVISGFLMTKIIFTGIDSHNFSILKFYAARCRRIIPALVVLCAALLAFGWFSLAPFEYQRLSYNSLSSIFFISNMAYWADSSYFSTDSAANWLLHTWSLSVEWQFYLIYPLIIAGAVKIASREVAVKALFLLFTTSIALSTWLAYSYPTSAFYLLPSRAWEMIAGGLVFLFPVSATMRTRKAMLYVGVIAIILSFVFMSESLSWPGMWAAIPVAGACLILSSSMNNNYITGNWLFQRIGDSSYSIYLWHWPFVVFLFNKSLLNNAWYLSLGILLSFIFGYSSFKLVEGNAKKSKLMHTFLSSISVAILLTLIYSTHGADVSFREMAKDAKANYPTMYSRDNYYNKNVYKPYLEDCNYYDAVNSRAKESVPEYCNKVKGSGGIVIWGDSHSQALGVGIRNAYTHIPVYQVASSACRPGLKMDWRVKGEVKKACENAQSAALELIGKVKPDIVIMAQVAKHEENDYPAIEEKLKSLGAKSVIVVGPVPQYMTALPVVIADRHWDKGEVRFSDSALVKHVMDTDKIMLSKHMNDGYIKYVSVIEKLCSGDVCLAKVDDDNTPIVWDYGHMTVKGSEYVTNKILKPVIDSTLKK